MIIDGLNKTKIGNKARIEATVEWEDSGRPSQKIYFETSEAFADDLTCDPHPFIIGCIVPAMHFGEKRIKIDGGICPELKEGLMTVMSWLRHWYYGNERNLVVIEAKPRPEWRRTCEAGRAGFFYSGGVDSFATLRSNRLNFPHSHPLSIKDGLLVYGFEVDEPEAFRHVLNSLEAASGNLGLTLIPVYTNIYLEYRHQDSTQGFNFWGEKFQAAALAAVANAFARRLSVVYIGGSSDIAHLKPAGTHPLLDHNYSSSDLRIRHDGIRLSRMDKVRLIAGWDDALQNLRVCNMVNQYRQDMLNCGSCPKCVKTMLALKILGVLDRTRAFENRDISAEAILKRAYIVDAYTEASYLDFIEPLTTMGRNDLVQAIEKRIAQYRNGEPLWKKHLKNIDARFLNNSLRHLASHLRQSRNNA